MESSFMVEVISVHRYPHHRIRRLINWLLMLSLVIVAVVLVIEIILGLVAGPLFLMMALFTAILLIPLLMRTVLHPEIELTADGLTLHPMIWEAQFVPWVAFERQVEHPLLFNNEGTGRLLHGKRYRPREGMVIVISDSAGLSSLYRLVGSLAGAGNRTAFAISSTTHTDYEALRDTIIQNFASAPEREKTNQ
jgi:hypothetical protein